MTLMPLGDTSLGGVAGYPLPKVGDVELRGLQMVWMHPDLACFHLILPES